MATMLVIKNATPELQEAIQKLVDDMQEAECTVDDNGTKKWWKHGKLHRDGDLPAIEYDGGKKYYKHGKLDRANGRPAVVCPDESLEWWVDGVHRATFIPHFRFIVYRDGKEEFFFEN